MGEHPSMSHLKSKVGPWKFSWKSVPRGPEGVVHVQLSPKEKLAEQQGEWIEVHWKRDAHGIWISLPYGIFGFDLKGQRDDYGRTLYQVTQRESPLEWADVSTSYGEEVTVATGRVNQSKALRVRSQMPGKMIKVMISAGQMVQKDQPIFVMEAMKMENEIRAPQAGKITQVKVVEGQAVETGADLVLIESLPE
jgi:biotin carboxyl carrier protein